ADFRILLKLNFIEHQFKEAKNVGKLRKYLHQVVCSQIEEKSNWFKECNLERYHVQSEHIDVVILLNVSLSETGSGILSDLRSHNIRSFTTNRHLSVIFGQCASAVDIAEEEMRGVAKKCHTYKQPTILLFLDFQSAFDSVDRSVLLDKLAHRGTPRKVREHNKAFLFSHFRTCEFKSQLLSDKLRDRAKDLTVTAEELLEFDTLSVVQASMTMVSTLPATSLDHNEYWNLPLKSVIDLIGNPGVCEANFKLPIYVDLGELCSVLNPVILVIIHPGAHRCLLRLQQKVWASNVKRDERINKHLINRLKLTFFVILRRFRSA
ncbi:hypothetical protein T265_14632, partial [Opisthorchis viverrini]